MRRFFPHSFSFACLVALPWLASCHKSGGTPAAAAPPNVAVSPAVAVPVIDTTAFSRQPYLQLATPTGMHIVWRQLTLGTPMVRWGTLATDLSGEATLDHGIIQRQLAAEGPGSAGTQPLHSAPPQTHQFETSITGLQPDRKYYYTILDGSKPLTTVGEEFTFRTLPTPGTARPGWFWVAGDGGTGGSIQAAVHTAMVNFTQQKNVVLDGFLHVGDMAYTKGLDSEFQGRFFAMYGETMRHTVCWPAMGNHEGLTSKGEVGVGPYYDSFICPTQGEAGGVASGREAYYAFDFGQIHYVVLDSCGESFTKKSHGLTALGEAMMQWLKADLEKAQAQWIIAYWHHPPYTKGSHDSDTEADFESGVMREKFLPMLESAGVDLVLSGHSHIYERSMLIDGAYSTPTVARNVVFDDGDGDPKGDGAYTKSAGQHPHEGFVAIVTGNAGTTLKRGGTIPLFKKIILEHGSVLFHVEGETLDGLMLNRDGKERDHFTIKKSGSVAARERLANPKAAPPMPEVRTVKADGTAGEDKEKDKERDKEVAEKDPSAPTDGKSDQRSKVPAPEKFTDVIKRGDTWKYLLNMQPPNWNEVGFDDKDWLSGPAGFGYGDDDDATTVLVKGKDALLRLRHEFTLPEGADVKKLGLLVSYDDAFVVWINGKEVTRSLNITGVGTAAVVHSPHEANGIFEYFPLEKAAELIHPGVNVIGISGYNDDLNSSDFSLSPQLILSN